MKKSPKKEGERPRRLTLSRETLQVLAEPALLELAEGGTGGAQIIRSGTTTEVNTGCT